MRAHMIGVMQTTGFSMLLIKSLTHSVQIEDWHRSSLIFFTLTKALVTAEISIHVLDLNPSEENGAVAGVVHPMISLEC